MYRPATYATYTEAVQYLQYCLSANYDSWFEATEDDRLKSLVSATRLMESLPWDGLPATATQELHHPVAGESEIPTLLKEACVEIAVSLLDGREPETEYRQQNVTSEAFGRVRVTRDTELLEPHIMAGIPSLIAWRKIRPYLRDVTGTVNVDRID